MSPDSVAETFEAHGCRIVARRVQGPKVTEFFLACSPPAAADAERATEAIYRTILDFLMDAGTDFGAVVSETLFLRDLRPDLEAVRRTRERVLASADGPGPHAATTEIEQPPLDEGVRLEVAVQAILPGASPLECDSFRANPVCDCAECARASALRVRMNGETRLYAGGLCGRGHDAYEQTLAMFGVAEGLLAQARLQFGDVVRTWIHLRDIDRDYADLNRARREFFEARGIEPVPASTGIGGGPAGDAHDVCLGVYAVAADSPPPRSVMTSPTLNEAGSYGADFVRGLRVFENNKIALHVSGTASIDEAGRSAHPGDFDAQAERMLVNVAALLEGQGATFGDIVSAVTYLKHPGDAQRLQHKFRDAGFEGFPNVRVAAKVCRPELLCETEVLAVLPAADSTQR